MTDKTIYSRFKKIADKYPDAPAIIEDGRITTYRRLDARVNDIMWNFAYHPHKRIGIVMDHGAHMIAAILAVLKSGASYVPAEKSLPPDRIDYMMRNARVKLVIDDSFCREAEAVCTSFTDRSDATSEAYVLYTSGTTGRPKGVRIDNSNVLNYADAFEDEFHIGPGDVMLQCSVCSFDIFVEEVFAALLNGAALAVPDAGVVAAGAEALVDFAGRHGVTVISGFPYLLADFNKLPSLPSSLRLLVSGGDVLRHSYIDNLKGRGIKIYNTYGPSETTVCATYQRCDNIDPLPDGTYPIGRPVKGVEVRIERGEICILGKGVGLGYVGSPPERRNFLRTPQGERMYRSGDLGYILPDGAIAFMRRKDDQVMIKGKRVEPREVENVLNLAPDVEKGVVCPFADAHGLAYLVAYFVPRGDYSLGRIRKWLASKLTDFMIPQYFVAMDTIPLTSHGKVDKKSLPVILRD